MTYHLERQDDPDEQVTGTVTLEDGIVYDVSVRQDGHHLAIQARYDSDATAEHFSVPADLAGTGPVKEEYGGVIQYVGTPPDLGEKRLEDYLAYVMEHDLDDV